MAKEEKAPIIIVKRKKKGGGGHHGGAWKVAYADFVTAMMALFIVLWLMNTSKQIQEAVGGYFKDPRGSSKLVGTNRSGSGAFVALKKEDMRKLKDDLLQSIHHLDPANKLQKQIEITITPEGLRIELMESAKGTFFELGSDKPTPALVKQLIVSNTDDIGAPADQQGSGRVDAYKAVLAAENYNQPASGGSGQGRNVGVVTTSPTATAQATAERGGTATPARGSRSTRGPGSLRDHSVIPATPSPADKAQAGTLNSR